MLHAQLQDDAGGDALVGRLAHALAVLLREHPSAYDVLTLQAFGLTVAQISETTGISKKSVVNRERRGYEQLVGLLQHQLSGPNDESGTMSVQQAKHDPLKAALKRGERARRSILAAQGELLDVAEVAARLGVGEEDVLRLQSRGRLLALPLQDRTLRFPGWQFAERGLMPGLDLVLRNIGVDDPWMQAAYFLSSEVRLDGQTPLEMLRRGEVEAVRRAAAAYGEQLAS